VQEQFLIEGLCEHPALSTQGPDVCLRQIEEGLKIAVEKARVPWDDVVAVGLDTPGPASSSGFLSARGSTNFVMPIGPDSIFARSSKRISADRSRISTMATPAPVGHFALFGAIAGRLRSPQ